jgi:transglutaminase-like putative cysteine protease
VPGDSYRVRSSIAAASAEALRSAGTEYPDWVRQADLQLPEDFPSTVEHLALDITAGASTPYDKAQAITDWLRSNIRYLREMDAPPAGAEPIEWFLFDSAGFCDYLLIAMS